MTSGLDPDARGTRLARWRDRLIGIVTAVLLMTAAGHMFFIVPTYRRLLQSIGVAVSMPSRLAIAVSHLGLSIFALILLGIGVAYWKQRRGAVSLVSAVLTSAALLSAVYLALVSCLYWDVARVMDAFSEAPADVRDGAA